MRSHGRLSGTVRSPTVFLHISQLSALLWNDAVKVWYPAILAHYRARRLGLKQYYRQLQIGPPSSNSNKSNDELPEKVKKAIELGRSHKFEHPLGVKSVKRYTASFDDCMSLLSSIHYRVVYM